MKKRRVGRHQINPILDEILSQVDITNIHKKYNKRTKIEWALVEYYNCLEVCRLRNYKNVLDFGCGIGMSKIIHSKFNFDFNLELADLNISWKDNEKDIFDKFTESLNINILRFTDITNEDFHFIDSPQIKYDAVIAFRFPPLSKLHVSVEDFKKRISPYCNENFDLIYYNVSPNWKHDHQMYIWDRTDSKERYTTEFSGYMVF